jgi:pimeloyl-ACP methyl ester carboxylesterase
MAPLFGQAMRPLVEAKLFDPAAIAPGWQAFPFAMTLRPSQLRASAAEAALMVPSAASLAPRYASLDVPVTIVSGEGDRIVDHASQSARLASELPQAKLITIGGVGHMVHYSATDRVVQAIEQALQQR